MLRYLVRRIGQAVVTASLIAALVFLVLHSRPDEAARRLAGDETDEAGAVASDRLQAVKIRYGLDEPLPIQLALWLKGLLRGDLGTTWRIEPGRGVSAVIAAALPTTLTLTSSALLVQIAAAIGLAAVGSRFRGRWPDALSGALSLAILALPEFCLGLLLLWPLSVQLGWLPVSAAASLPGAARGPVWVDHLWHLVLPALCLGLTGAGGLARLLRARWSEEAVTRYAAAARARGSSLRRAMWTHALRGALGPLCAAVGLAIPRLFGGAVTVEFLFAWPGMGSLLAEAVGRGDLPLVAGINLMIALLVAGGGLLADAFWSWADPRVRVA